MDQQKTGVVKELIRSKDFSFLDPFELPTNQRKYIIEALKFAAKQEDFQNAPGITVHLKGKGFAPGIIIAFQNRGLLKRKDEEGPFLRDALFQHVQGGGTSGLEGVREAAEAEVEVTIQAVGGPVDVEGVQAVLNQIKAKQARLGQVQFQIKGLEELQKEEATLRAEIDELWDELRQKGPHAEACDTPPEESWSK